MVIIISPAEVASRAFPSSLDPEGGFIPESSILAAQQKFMKPVLGTLYPHLGKYPELVDKYVKPALAQWVRYLVLPTIASQVGSMGIISPRGQTFESVAPMSVAALRARTKSDARALTARMVEHIEVLVQDYPEYDPEKNIMNRVSVTGNIVL